MWPLTLRVTQASTGGCSGHSRRGRRRHDWHSRRRNRRRTGCHGRHRVEAAPAARRVSVGLLPPAAWPREAQVQAAAGGTTRSGGTTTTGGTTLLQGVFAATGSMSTERYTHTATLLQSGKGAHRRRQGYSGCLASAELYDPTVGAFSAAGTLATARSVQTATLLQDGRVLIVGDSMAT